eukprot:3233733-Prymnesium_polylepis.1
MVITGRPALIAEKISRMHDGVVSTCSVSITTCAKVCGTSNGVSASLPSPTKQLSLRESSALSTRAEDRCSGAKLMNAADTAASSNTRFAEGRRDLETAALPFAFFRSCSMEMPVAPRASLRSVRDFGFAWPSPFFAAAVHSSVRPVM